MRPAFEHTVCFLYTQVCDRRRQVSPLLALTTPPFCHCPRTGVTRRSPIAHLDSQAVNTQGSTAQIRQVLVH